MTVNRFDNYNDILNNLISEAISCTPESWTSGTLAIDCDGRAINYSLKNPNEEERAQLSDQLRSLCEQLYVVMREHGDLWVEATIDFAQMDEKWSFNTNFKYEETVENTTGEEHKSQGKPWWKVW